MKPALIILLALPLAGCGLDALEGKPSDFQIYQERVSALETKVSALSSPVVASVSAPIPEPVTEPVEEPCQPIFRVKTCP